MSSASYHELEAELSGVERALRALDDGTYGLCAACDQPIDPAALEVEPTATLCPEHRDRPQTEEPRTDNPPMGQG